MSGGDRTPERTILPPDRLDDVGEAVIALARELWVLTDRQMVLEAVLGEQGIDTNRIETYQPDEATAEKMRQRRQQIIDNLLHALKAG